MTEFVDSENPVINDCPGEQSVTADYGATTAVVSWTPPTATDDSGTQTLTPDYSPGDSFPIGTTTVTYTSMDDAGKTTTCSFNVIVSGML